MEKGTVTINQEKYVNDVLHRFSIQEDKPVSTPYEAGLYLSGDDCQSKDKRDVEYVYLRRFMEQIGYAQKSPTLIAQDNKVSIYLTQGTRMYHKANHIDTRVYKVRELSSGDDPEVKLWKIDGSDQPSDIFTKVLPRVSFECHRGKIMGTAM